jgi:Brp/Blh family beta-carotene 15,15'-monooxygenase
MHSLAYMSLCLTAMVGVHVFGFPQLNHMAIGVGLAIAVVGVPHGGLDHWTGRRLLWRWLAHRWWLLFFPLYLTVGLAFAWGWLAAPTLFVVLFFLVSAWHFGREEPWADRCETNASATRSIAVHTSAAAVGGMVIWIPALFRPQEFLELLRMIVPASGSDPAVEITFLTGLIGGALVPVAAAVLAKRLMSAPLGWDNWVPLATASVAIWTPILISFSIYFCGWHSWQGLQRLRRAESLSPQQFARSIAPLSALAVAGVVAAGWWLQRWPVDISAASTSTAYLPTIFIGLSAIAVPHLILHELDARTGSAGSNCRVHPS